MDTERDFWLWLAALVLVLAGCAWAAASHLGAAYSLWIYSLAGVLFLLMIATIVVIQYAPRVRGVIATDEVRKEYRRSLVQQIRELIPSGLFFVGITILDRLVRDNILPQWAGLLLFPLLLGGWIWLWRIARRSRLPGPPSRNITG